MELMKETRKHQAPITSAGSFEAFVNSTSIIALKETHIGSSDLTAKHLPALQSPATFSQSMETTPRSRRDSSSSISSIGQGELIRVPSETITITKEKVSGGGRGPTISKERSRPSQGGSAQTSGQTTPTNAKPPRMLSEAALKVSASLLSHNDRLSESPDRLGSVFNAEYNVSPAKQNTVANVKQELSPPASEPVSPILGGPEVVASAGEPRDVHSPDEVSDLRMTADSHRSLNGHSAVSDDGQLMRLMKLNAQLEGKLEVLSVEAEAAIKERAKYSSELGVLRSQLQLLEKKQMSDGNASAHADVSHLREESGSLRRQNSELQSLVISKTAETTRMAANLSNLKEAVAKLQQTVNSYDHEIKAKESELSTLKSKLKLVESQVGTISDDKQDLIDKISCLRDDITSLSETKEWFQKQLHSAQEARNNLQTELTRLQNLVASQADALERVKVENSQLKLQLNDTQHKALTEKQLLIRHLEAIEADMLEREAGFEQLEKEKGLTEYSWQQKMMQIEKERMSLSKMVSQSSDTQQDLERTKHSLQAKLAEIEVLENQQDELNRRLMEVQQAGHVTRKELEFTKERLIECESTLQKVQKQDKERGALLQTLKQEKASLQIALDSALEEKKTFSKAVETLKTNTAKVEQNYRQMKQDLTARNERVVELEQQNVELAAKAELVEQVAVQQQSAPTSQELDDASNENRTLKDHVNQLRTSVEDAEDRAERVAVEKRTLEQQLANMKSNAAELEHILQKSHSEKVAIETKLNSCLHRLHEQSQVSDQYSQLQQQHSLQQKKVEELKESLAIAESDLKDRSTDHDSSMSIMAKQLQDALSERDSARKELRQHEETSQATSSSQLEHLYAQIQMLRSQLEATQIQKSDLEKQISSYHSGVQSAVQEYQKRLAESAAALSQCQQQLADERSECELTIDRYRAQCEQTRQTTMELEKERGRLTVLSEQHGKLKQHANDLETALSQREATLVQLQATNLSASKKHDLTDEEQKMRIRQLLEDLNNQTSKCESVERQFEAFKENAEGQKEEESKLMSEMDSLKQELEKKALALVAAQSELSTATEMVERQSTNISMLNKEYRSAKIELEQLRRSVSENAAKSPIISDEIQALQWQVKQRTQEAADAKSQLSLCEQRMEIETESIRKALADAKKELDCVKLEMEAVRKDKLSYQSRVTMLRSALKNLLNQCKVLSSSLPESYSKNPNLTVDEAKYEELLRETTSVGYKSKPLENLKTCLSSLHSEISTLQHQMDEHKSALKTNSESWRAVETEVADLEKLINASREATKARSSHANAQENII